jgi:hypothetical protein
MTSSDATVPTRTPWPSGDSGRAGLVARWILQCNPERYRLRDALRDGFDVRSWTVSRYLWEIGPGDKAAMWISGPSAGVYALAVIIEQLADELVLADFGWDPPVPEDVLHSLEDVGGGSFRRDYGP